MQLQNWNLAQANSQMVAVSSFLFTILQTLLKKNLLFQFLHYSDTFICLQELNIGKEKVSLSIAKHSHGTWDHEMNQDSLDIYTLYSFNFFM